MKIPFINALISATLAFGLNAAAKAQADIPSNELQAKTIMSFEALLPGGESLLAKNEVASNAIPYAPAPPLTNMWVYAVGSTNCGWESTAGSRTTACDHGGAMLRVAILEIGYSGLRIARMNGGTLPISAAYDSDLVCIVRNSYVWPCPVGMTAVGFVRYYTLDGEQAGRFEYQATSANAPRNTMSVGIDIR